MSLRGVPTADDVDAVDAAAAVFEAIVDVVERRVAAGRLRSAIGWARAAASFAVSNPTGYLRSPRLEALIHDVSLAARLDDRGGLAVRRSHAHGSRRILHVITETHLLGGHRSVLLTWLDLDRGSHADVAITRPVGQDSALTEAVGRQGGSVHALVQRDPLERAASLRSLTREYDHIVVHAHADDALAAVALHDVDGTLPPQLMVDHADHVFWLLPGSPALHASVRPAAVETAVSLRGVPATAATWLPIPIAGDARLSTQSPSAVRVAAGVPADAVLCVTVARAVKYRRSPHHPGFLDVVVPAVTACPGTYVLAVGPDPHDDEWASASARTGGRVIAVGEQDAPAAYLAAADIYLDPFPFTSHTSMLEAASHGLPILGGSQYTGTSELLGSSTLLAGAPVVAHTPQDYAATLCQWVSDPVQRAASGRRAQAVVAEYHAGDVWVPRLEQILASACTPGAAASCGEVRRDPHYAEILRGTESEAPLQWILAAARSDLDLPDRLRTALVTWRDRLIRRAVSGQQPQGIAGARSFVHTGWKEPA